MRDLHARSLGSVRRGLMSGAAALCLAAAAHAQTVPAQPQGTAVTAAGDQLEEVIVTARRRSENLQQVPMSVDVLDNEQLRKSDIQDAGDLQHFVPALNVVPTIGGANAQFNIRGEGQITGADPGVLTYFNEVPLSLGSATPGLFYDLENVQVLKGPQGTLFGRNTIGGAILLSPKQPGETFGGYVQGTFGSYDRRGIEGAVDIPIVTDKLFVRIATHDEWQDGYTRDVNTGTSYDNMNLRSMRASVLFKPTEDFKNLLMVHAYDMRSNGSNASIQSYNPNGLALALYPNLPQLLAEQQARGPRNVALSASGDDSQLIHVSDVATWNINENLTLKNIVSLAEARLRANRDYDGTPLQIVDINNPAGLWTENEEDISEEIQLQGNALDDKLTYVVGGFYGSQSPNDPSTSIINEFGANGVTQMKSQNSETKALFVQGTYDFGGLTPVLDGLKLTGGFRRTWDDKSAVVAAFLPYPGLSPGVCIGTPFPTCAFSSAAGFSANTYDVDLTYRITPDVMAYVTHRRGFKSGGFNNLPVAGYITFGPEYVEDWEGGLKTQWEALGMHGRFNIDGFVSDASNVQTIFGAIVAGSAAQLTANAASATTSGIDVDADLQVNRDFKLGLSYAWLDSTVSRFTNPVTGQVSLNQPMPFVSRNKLAIHADYTVYRSDAWGNVSLGADYTYQSPFITGGGATLETPSYGVFDLRAEWVNIGGYPLTASLIGTNIADKTYVRFRNDNLNSIGVAEDLYGPPRMITFQLRYDFGS